MIQNGLRRSTQRPPTTKEPAQHQHGLVTSGLEAANLLAKPYISYNVDLFARHFLAGFSGRLSPEDCEMVQTAWIDKVSLNINNTVILVDDSDTTVAIVPPLLDIAVLTNLQGVGDDVSMLISKCNNLRNNMPYLAGVQLAEGLSEDRDYKPDSTKTYASWAALFNYFDIDMVAELKLDSPETSRQENDTLDDLFA